MKKLLIATSIIVMSSTAMAATDEQRNTDSTTLAVFKVKATYVETLEITILPTVIDFGEVFTGATVENVDVQARVAGGSDEPFEYTIATSGNIVTLNNGTDDLTGSSALVSGVATIDFKVGLDSSLLVGDLAEQTVTTTVIYTEIEGTTIIPYATSSATG